MPGQSVTLNGYNFQDTTIITSKIDHETLSIDEAKVKIPHRSGEKLVSYTYADRSIILEGHIVSTSASGLDGKIDEFKQNIIGAQAVNLDVNYLNNTRRYTVNVKQVTLARDFDNITMVPYHIELEAINPPFGQDTTSISGSYSTSISGIFNATTSGLVSGGNFTILGTAAPAPAINFTVQTAGSLSSIVYSNDTTGTVITVSPTGSPAFVNGDRIVINTQNAAVTKNGVAVNFSGVFPTFLVGNNSYTITLNGTGPNYVVSYSVEYTKWYL